MPANHDPMRRATCRVAAAGRDYQRPEPRLLLRTGVAIQPRLRVRESRSPIRCRGSKARSARRLAGQFRNGPMLLMMLVTPGNGKESPVDHAPAAAPHARIEAGSTTRLVLRLAFLQESRRLRF